MAKEVTVLGIEGGYLHGVRLEERNGAYECAAAESWPIEEEQPAAVPEAGETSDAPAPSDESGEDESVNSVAE